jgi:parvulin-like peptidyl-prolyl isomerase
MTNPTVQRPAKRRSTPSSAAPAKGSAKGAPTPATAAARSAAKTPARPTTSASKYRVRQTGRVEGLRDGKPLIFGWGRHLTRAQKLRYQKLGLIGFAGLAILAVLATVGYGILNETVLIPNSTVVKVNGVSISQTTYRKNLAVEAQILWNTMQDEIRQDAAIQPLVQKGDSSATTQDAILQSQIQSNEGKYTQSVITQTAINDLIDDQIIQQGAKQFERAKHLPAATFDATPHDVDLALAAFKKAFPKTETYASFLSANRMTESDVRAALAIQVRRTKMSNYLSGALVSPTRQVQFRKIETDTAAKAAAARAALVKGGTTVATWTTVAKADSLDPNSKDNGGDAGFVAPGTGDPGLEVWIYDASRKVGDLSPVLADASGTFDVVQIEAIDPSRAVDANTLKSAQENALPHWLSMQQTILGSKVGTPDATMLTLTRNMPVKPDLNGALPTFTPPPGAGGAPGGGIPGIGG